MTKTVFTVFVASKLCFQYRPNNNTIKMDPSHETLSLEELQLHVLFLKIPLNTLV
jgi:hypothetical protein